MENEREKFYPEEISEMVFKKQQKNANKKVTNTVVTVPAYFNGG
jgi:molecular chaperone DnaK (HSP70)